MGKHQNSDRTPIAICALGGFVILLGGEALSFPRKAPRKPLALLKALIAFGGREVSEFRLQDALWPDVEGDGARDCFNMAVHRLRRLLGRSDALRVQGGRVTLDEGRCCVDVREFEALDAAAAGDPAALLERVLALYRGPFLGGEDDEAWAIGPREHLRERFLRLVGAGAGRLAAAGRWDEALHYYRRGLDVEPLAEPLCQGIMQAALRLGRAAEGMAAYRRLQRTLLAEMGTGACLETERLRRRLLA